MRWFVWARQPGKVWKEGGLTYKACGIPTREGEQKLHYLGEGKMHLDPLSRRSLAEWEERIRVNLRDGFWKEIQDPTNRLHLYFDAEREE